MSSGRRGVLAILFGTAGGQALVLMAAPVLSRIYSPSDFGVFAVISAVVTMLAMVTALRFDLAVPLPVEDEDAYALFALGVVSSLCLTVLGLVAISLFGHLLAQRFHVLDVMPLLWLAPVIAGATAIYTLLSQLAIRHHRYTTIARRNVAQSAAVAVTQISTGLLGFAPGGLVVGLGVGQLTSALTLGRGAGLRSPAARAGITLRRLRACASSYKKFPLLLAPAGLINVAGTQVPVVLVASWYGADVAGWLGMTQRVLALPVMLIGTTVAQVYLGRIAEAARRDNNEIRALFSRTSRRLLLIGLPVGIFAAVLGPWVFPLVLGSQWSASGLYAQALSMSLAAQLIAAPLSQTLTVLVHQVLQLIWDIGRLLITSGAVAVCWLLGASATTAVWSFGAAAATAYVASWFLSRHKVRAREVLDLPREERSTSGR